MAFLKYTDLPIFANFIDQTSLPNTVSAQHLFAATDASVSLDASVATSRFLASKPAMLIANGPLEAKLSFSFYPMIEVSNTNERLNVQKQNQRNFFGLTGDFANGHNIQFSNFLFKKTYLQNYSIKINPYQPVVVTANMVSYDISEIEGRTLDSFGKTYEISSDPEKPRYEALHGLTTSIDSLSQTNILPKTKTSIEINVDCQRTPIYTLGSKFPDSVVLNTVERTTTVQGENVNSIMDINGKEVRDLNVLFLPLSSLGKELSNATTRDILNFNINGKIISQQLSVAQNSSLNGRIIIKDIIL
jgi:hypothetical protein